MIERRKINNVLKRVFAAEAEEAPKEKTKEAPVAEKPDQESSKGKPVTRKRYYFFDANPGNSIPFTALKDVLKSEDRDSLIRKLQGGNTGSYFADYFSWLKVCLITDEYGGKDVVYQCTLNPSGTKRTNSVEIFPEDAPVTPEAIEADFLLFDNERGNVDLIQIDKSSESYFIDKTPPENIAKILLAKTVPPGNLLNYSGLQAKFDNYRIWAENLTQLVLPDFNIPTNDQADGGHYKGGETAFKDLVGPVKKDVKSEDSLGSKLQKKEEDTKFEPVDEQKENENRMDKKASKDKKKKKSKGDYSSEPYSGGTDVMQRLVKDQRAHMDIRRASRKVVARFIEAAFTSTAPTQTTSPSSPSSTGQEMKIPVSQDPKKNTDNAKKLQEYATKQQEQQAIQTELKKTQQLMQKNQQASKF